MRQSAGILLYRVRDGVVEVLLVHPGGPYWARKDAGAWTIPKGEFGSDESPLAAACREFREETGADVDVRDCAALRTVRQAGGKVVHAFAVRGDFDPAMLASNTFSMEWPPRSGTMRAFPEVDRAQWFDLTQAAAKLHPAQCVWLADVAAICGDNAASL